MAHPIHPIMRSFRLLMFGWSVGVLLCLITPIEALSSSVPSSLTQQPSQQTTEQTSSSSTPNNKNTNLQDNVSLRKKITGSIAKGERRAYERSRAARPVCAGCQRPPRLCLCNVLPPHKYSTNNMRILILQHPNEFKKRHLSTVPLMKLVLDEESLHIQVGYRFDFVQDIQPLLNDDDDEQQKPLLLYPGPDAWDLDHYAQHAMEAARVSSMNNDPTQHGNGQQENSSNPPTPTTTTTTTTLIVMDGTWTEAKRMVRDSVGLLESCQGVQFTTEQSSLYEPIRQEPAQHCLSTLEACALALEKMTTGNTTTNTTTNDYNATLSVSDCLRSVMARHVELHVHNAATLLPRFNQDGHSVLKKQARRNELEAALMNGNHHHNAAYTSSSFTPTVPLPKGVRMRLLTLADAPLIDSWWEHQSPKSLKMIYRTLQTNHGFCLGIVGKESKDLRACVVRYEQGAVGMLHTRAEYRGRGYGTALLAQLTQLLQDRHLPCLALIRDGNKASEAVFRKVGWVKANPHAKKGTGKRRANRQWIKPAGGGTERR